jgi:5-(carboxyamino)imidazole ribonucleotide synthase
LELAQSFEAFGRVPCVLEQRMVLQDELSVVIARDFQGAIQAYPVCSNVHRNGILFVSTAPANTTPELRQQAGMAAKVITERLNYVGVLCVEFFVVDGELIINEIAPRPHNSGHFTIDACITSQFEQQVRVLAGLPMGSTRQHSYSVMVNILGDAWFAAAESAPGVTPLPTEPIWANVLRHGEAKLHLYGKAQARIGRKMGHITVLEKTADGASRVATTLVNELNLRRYN